jgi:acetyl-CoA acetyltransferase
MGIAVGFEKMGKSGLVGVGPTAAPPGKTVWEPAGQTGTVLPIEGVLGSGLMPAVFAEVGMEYANNHDGVGFEQFAKVAVKSHEHSTLNPYSAYRKAFSLDEVMNAEVIAWPNTLPMCGPTGDGAAAAVVIGLGSSCAIHILERTTG